MKATENSVELKYGIQPPRIVKAVYTQSRFPSDKGNWLIEALPELLPLDWLMKHYYKGMEIKPSIDASADEQIEEVSFLRNVRIPLEFIRNLERTLHREIIESYRYRRKDLVPYAIDTVVGNEADKQAVTFMDNIGGDGDTGLSLLGESGCGKSTAVEQMLAHYPRMIIHDLPTGTFKQIIWIRAVMTVNSDLHSLYSSLADSVDQALGNIVPYYGKAIRKLRRISEKADMIAKLIRRFAIGVIVIDEIQNMSPSSNKASSYNSILTITNTTKVVLFTVGTEEAYPLFLRNHYTARRSGTPIRASEYCRNPELCYKIEKLLMGVNWFKEPLVITDELLAAFYEVTLGFIGRMISVWMEVQFQYIKAKRKPEITPDLIRKCARVVYTAESSELAKEAALNNVLFSVEENKAYQTSGIQNEGYAEQHKAKVMEGESVSEEDFSEFEDRKHAFSIYVRVKMRIREEGNKYNWNTILKTVKHVLSLKGSAKLSDEALIAKSVASIQKKKTDLRKKEKAVNKTMPIDSMQNIFELKK